MAVTEWDHRELCPDGGCIGVIGPDGLCKVCGRAAPNWGDERNRGLANDEESDSESESESESDAESESGSEAEAAAEGAEDDDEADDEDEDEDEPAGEWDNRQLCPDGACVGVIGDDGKCNVCGRSAP